MENILVATDGSTQAGRAVAKAAELAKTFGAAMTIVNVQDAKPLRDMETHFAEVELADRLKNYAFPSTATGGGLTVETSLQDAIVAHDQQSLALRQVLSDNILLRARDIANQAGVAGVSTRSANGDAANEIVSAAKAAGADLIVLGRRGLSGIAELLLGSVSQKVLHQAQVDVLTVA